MIYISLVLLLLLGIVIGSLHCLWSTLNCDDIFSVFANHGIIYVANGLLLNPTFGTFLLAQLIFRALL